MLGQGVQSWRVKGWASVSGEAKAATEVSSTTVPSRKTGDAIGHGERQLDVVGNEHDTAPIIGKGAEIRERRLGQRADRSPGVGSSAM